jgi:hypothetical protein
VARGPLKFDAIRGECVGWDDNEKEGAAPTTIEITKLEVEALINQRLKSGALKDAEEVILQALQSSPPPLPEEQSSVSLLEVFEKIRGRADDIDFSRNPSTGRPVDLPR